MTKTEVQEPLEWLYFDFPQDPPNMIFIGVKDGMPVWGSPVVHRLAEKQQDRTQALKSERSGFEL